ncbi:MAG: diaminopimelate epimerase [Clostridiales bacterium]|nr:diaminopimelate epimerase [Clostridiales bacterium]
MPFTKMHGIGNDYIYFNCLESELQNPEDLSVFLSDRHFAIGGDGIVMILPSEAADYRMRMFNADGSEGKMCGNAIRCVGKFLYDNKITDKTDLSIETLSGIKYLKLFIIEGLVESVEVDMGKPELRPANIPVLSKDETFINQPITVDSKIYNATCVSMGNPHAVIFMKDIDSLNLAEIGPKFEHHPLFPDRVNTEFVEVLSKDCIKMRVWERGSGETFACGTGACASVVASVLNEKCDKNREITVLLRGGELKITWAANDTVLMKGPATKVFDGIFEI